MSELPPPFTEARFQEVEGATTEQIRKRVAPFVNDLHSFLSRSSCLRDIQHTRRDRNPEVRSNRAFDGFAVDREHWYTYNTGGRNEAQFNIGLFPEYLRIGLGFEFTKKMYGDPEAVQSAYGRFRDVLRQHRQGFDRFSQENSLQVEWRPEGRSRLEYVPTEEVSRWLLRPPRVPDWVFVGRLLYRGRDAEILENSSRLKEAMESVFEGFKPLWEQAQTAAQT